MPKPLTENEIAARLDALNQGLESAWERRDGSLCKTFVFSDFVAAFGFMTRVALIAERLDHHPDWKNCHRRVEIALSTHQARAITRLDFELAAAIERAAGM